MKMINGATTEGQKQEITNRIKKYGGYSIFWITENEKRAKIATDLVDSGVIISVEGSGYPWCPMKLNVKRK